MSPPLLPPSRRRKVLLSCVAALAVLAAAFVLDAGLGRPAAGDRGVPSALIGRPAPPLVGTTLDGEHLDLAALRGSVVLVNVWASWCGPCRDELPLLVATQQRLAGRGLRVVGLDFRDGEVPARALLTEAGASHLPSVADPDGRQGVAWGVRGVPETFVVDREGTVRAACIGPLTEGWIAGSVDPLLS